MSPFCPSCSVKLTRWGKTIFGKQRYRCPKCFKTKFRYNSKIRTRKILFSFFRDYILYGDFVHCPISSPSSHNLSIDQDETLQWFVEIRVYGDTKKKDVLNLWPQVEGMKRMLPGYRNPKSAIRSEAYNKIAKAESLEEVADDEKLDNKNGGFNKRLRIARIHKKRLDKFLHR